MSARSRLRLAARLCAAFAVLLLAGITRLAAAADFELVTLGSEGGLHEGQLNAWLLRAPGEAHYLALDAGTLLPGIEAALRAGAFADRAPDGALTPAGAVLRQAIAGYFISHAHLDHLAGLLIASTDDTRKPVYGLAATLQTLSDDYFNWAAWPNFADRGAAPALGQYPLRAQPPEQAFAIDGTALRARLYPLAHDRLESSMILVQHGDAYLAYFGDTGPDEVQRSTRLARVWQVLGPLQRRGALKGLIIECSYPDAVEDTRLFGHLKPQWLLAELRRFEREAGGAGALSGLDVVVTHIKPSLQAGADPRALIAAQLAAAPALGVRFRLPRQGEHFSLPAAP